MVSVTLFTHDFKIRKTGDYFHRNYVDLRALFTLSHPHHLIKGNTFCLNICNCSSFIRTFGVHKYIINILYYLVKSTDYFIIRVYIERRLKQILHQTAQRLDLL